MELKGFGMAPIKGEGHAVKFDMAITRRWVAPLTCRDCGGDWLEVCAIGQNLPRHAFPCPACTTVGSLNAGGAEFGIMDTKSMLAMRKQ